jgi:hypothetical protein
LAPRVQIDVKATFDARAANRVADFVDTGPSPWNPALNYQCRSRDIDIVPGRRSLPRRPARRVSNKPAIAFGEPGGDIRIPWAASGDGSPDVNSRARRGDELSEAYLPEDGESQDVADGPSLDFPETDTAASSPEEVWDEAVAGVLGESTDPATGATVSSDGSNIEFPEDVIYPSSSAE